MPAAGFLGKTRTCRPRGRRESFWCAGITLSVLMTKVSHRQILDRQEPATRLLGGSPSSWPAPSPGSVRTCHQWMNCWWRLMPALGEVLAAAMVGLSLRDWMIRPCPRTREVTDRAPRRKALAFNATRPPSRTGLPAADHGVPEHMKGKPHGGFCVASGGGGSVPSQTLGSTFPCPHTTPHHVWH